MAQSALRSVAQHHAIVPWGKQAQDLQWLHSPFLAHLVSTLPTLTHTHTHSSTHTHTHKHTHTYSHAYATAHKNTHARTRRTRTPTHTVQTNILTNDVERSLKTKVGCPDMPCFVSNTCTHTHALVPRIQARRGEAKEAESSCADVVRHGPSRQTCSNSSRR